MTGAPAWGAGTEKVQVVCVNAGVLVCAGGQQSDKPPTDQDEEEEEEVKGNIKQMCAISVFSSDRQKMLK